MHTDTQLTSGERATLTPVSPAEAATLKAHAARKVLRPASEHGITELQPVGFGRIASAPQVVTGEQSDWLILPAELDPLYQQAQLAAPPKVRARIRELLAAGVWFDSVAIAHQVPSGTLASVNNSEELQRLLEPPTPKSLTVLPTVISSLAAVTVSLAVGVINIGKDIGQPLTRSLDPMIFGAVVATPPATVGDAALFFLAPAGTTSV